jgi:putative CocE/NonD family hydrolase
VLVYTSPPLEEDLTIIGPVSAVLYAATSAPDTDFTVKLCDVSPEGRSTNVQEGIVRARYRESLSNPTLVTPNEVYEYRIQLGPTAHAFKAWHRVRVQVSSSDFPQWDRNLNTGGSPGIEGAAQARVATQTVLHDANHPSHVTLPVVDR